MTRGTHGAKGSYLGEIVQIPYQHHPTYLGPWEAQVCKVKESNTGIAQGTGVGALQWWKLRRHQGVGSCSSGNQGDTRVWDTEWILIQHICGHQNKVSCAGGGTGSVTRYWLGETWDGLNR